MEVFKPPNVFSFTSGNVAENWRKWEQSFNNYMIATEKNDKPDKIKIAILINLLGDEGIAVFNTFKFEGNNSECYNEVIKTFREYCLPSQNIVFERFNFFSCIQKDGQNVESYVTELKTLASSCEFGDQEESLIRDRIVLGIKDNGLQERLLREPQLTMKQASEFIRAYETSKKQTRIIQEPSSSNIDINTINFKKNKSNSETTYNCNKCGRMHKYRECPAFGKSCNKCKGKNHFASMCHASYFRTRNQSRYVSEIRENTNVLNNESDLYINVVNVQKLANIDDIENKKAWSKVINVEGKRVEFKLDTGAEANILPLNEYKNLNIIENKELRNSNVILVSYGNYKIKPEGQIKLRCKTDSIREIEIEFQIVNIDSKPILGLKACEKLNLIKRIDLLKINDKEEILKKYSTVFNGQGIFPGQPYHIELKEDVTPVIDAPRRVPQILHQSLKMTLEKLERERIITHVNKPTDWVNSLVIVEKPNGSLRICLDPRNLNKAIKREHHIIPSADEIINRLEGKKFFSVLDLKEGFWQIPLDENSSYLCTFNSPFGRYKFNRLPFGIASAPEVFQKRNQKLFGDISGVEIYFDDLIISGIDQNDHDKNLLLVLERAKINNVKFNPDKFQFKVPEVRYMGQIISKEGIKIDPGHVEAINKLDKPLNKSDIRRLLGMVNFVSKFIPNVSTVTAPLRNLLKNDIQFSWDFEQEEAFEGIKRLLSKAPVLKVFNSSKEIIIQCDSSKDGLGACLIQENHPVSFASRSLTDNEKNYAQIEKELLAIVFAFEKFHNFIYGRHVIVHSDHKPLATIVNKPLSKISTRLQRMVLRLIKYNYTLHYIPGSQMFLADTLSRAYLKDKVIDDPEMFNMVHSISKYISMSERRVKEFREAIQKDEELSLVYQYCKEGWPQQINSVPPSARKYYKLKNDLQIIDDLLFINEKVLVPHILRREMLLLIHEGHFGIEKSKNRARELLYWPKMNQEIEDLVLNCEVCEQFRRHQSKEPLLPHTIPQRPFHKVGIDLMEFRNKTYLVLIDYYSKWIEVEILQNKTMEEVIGKLKLIFARYGIPMEVISDNNPFNSFLYKSFAKEWDFECKFTSPHYSQSNGMVERAVGITKVIFKKAFEDNKYPYAGLMEYRNTPISGLGLSPAQMMFNRRLRTKLPISNKLLNPKLFVGIKEKMLQRQNKQKYYYDRSAKMLPSIIPGNRIRVRNPKEKFWKSAILMKKDENPRSYLIKTATGNLLRRNRRHIIKSNTYTPMTQQQSDFNYSSIPEISNNGYDSGSQQANQCSHQSYRTRYGRISRRPSYLNDYVT